MVIVCSIYVHTYIRAPDNMVELMSGLAALKRGDLATWVMARGFEGGMVAVVACGVWRIWKCERVWGRGWWQGVGRKKKE